MYKILTWLDHAVTPGNTYKVKENSNGTITLTPTGEVIQQGTNMSAVNFNNLETGVLAANLTALEAIRNIKRLLDKETALEGVILNAALTNTQKYPFNNSTKTIALSGANVRYNKNYTVTVEVESYTGGCVGDVVISDKLLNGFKVAYTGSAQSVNLKIYIQVGA